MPVQDQRGIEGYVFLAAYIACIPLANWMIGHVGTVCVPQGPCLVPVAPGLMAPSGVLLVGLALVLRDLVQRRLGIAYALAAIAVGAVLSGVLAPLPLVVASTTAFLLSELADFAVYTPLQKRGLVLAVLASSFVGLVAELDRVSVARLRQLRVSARPDRRQGLDGAVDAARNRVAAPPRPASRLGAAGLRHTQAQLKDRHLSRENFAQPLPGTILGTSDSLPQQSREASMSDQPLVLVERDGPVTIISINRPERRNAVNGATAKVLFDAFLAFDADESASVAVFTGSGGYFCAGADLKMVAAGDPEKSVRSAAFRRSPRWGRAGCACQNR